MNRTAKDAGKERASGGGGERNERVKTRKWRQSAMLLPATLVHAVRLSARVCVLACEKKMNTNRQATTKVQFSCVFCCFCWRCLLLVLLMWSSPIPCLVHATCPANHRERHQQGSPPARAPDKEQPDQACRPTRPSQPLFCMHVHVVIRTPKKKQRRDVSRGVTRSVVQRMFYSRLRQHLAFISFSLCYSIRPCSI